MTDTIKTPTDTILRYISSPVLAHAQKGVLRDDLSEKLGTTTVDTEHSLSAARERQENVGVDSSTSVPRGVHSPLGGRAAERSSGRGEADMPVGEIVRLEKYGLGFIKAEGTGEQYPFRFDQIVGFKGESLNEMPVRVGSKVFFELQNGRISEIRPRG